MIINSSGLRHSLVHLFVCQVVPLLIHRCLHPTHITEHYDPLVHQPATAKFLQSCLTLCSPIEGSLPGSPVSGILQARTLEWVAISFSNA